MTPAAGEIWLADRGDDERRLVFVISDVRFHRLAERAVVAPVLDHALASPRPWHVLAGGHTVAVNQLVTTSLDRLLERVESAGFETLRQVQRAVHEITR